MKGVTVYEVIALPLSAGAVHDTTADESPADAVTPVGTFGAGGDSAAGRRDHAGNREPRTDDRNRGHDADRAVTDRPIREDATAGRASARARAGRNDAA